MTTAPIIIEERLSSSGLATALGAVALFEVAAGASVLSRPLSTSRRWTLMVAVSLSTAIVLLCSTLAFRVVARVVEGPSGRTFEVLYGPGGLVRQSFGPEQIIGASSRRTNLFTTGGWGYRGSLRLFRRAAVVTRGGDAIELRLTKGRRFIVTVDEPESFVAALNIAAS